MDFEKYEEELQKINHSRLEMIYIQAKENVKKLQNNPSNDDLLKLYGLFKQIEFGNNTTPKPNFLNMKDTAKWNSWKKYENMDRYTAMRQYNYLVEILISKN